MLCPSRVEQFVSAGKPAETCDCAYWSVALRRRSLAVAVALVLMASACSKGDDKAASSTTARETTTSTIPPDAPKSPLTGQPTLDEARRTRAALVVKIDNDPIARPQAGLQQTDVIIEERVEGGIVRFIAIFHSQDSPAIGPIRSVRSTDADILRPIGGLFAFSGGIPAVIQESLDAGMKNVGARKFGAPYYRRKDRKSPNNVYSSTDALRAVEDDKFPTPPQLFQYMDDDDEFGAAGAAPMVAVTAPMSNKTVGHWDYNAQTKLWMRSTNNTPHTVEGGGQLDVPNVIIQFVPYQRTKYVDRSGTPVDKAVVTGTGQAVVLVEGKSATVTWSKPDPGAVTTYTDSAGKPVELRAGRTWVMLVPVGTLITQR